MAPFATPGPQDQQTTGDGLESCLRPKGTEWIMGVDGPLAFATGGFPPHSTGVSKPVQSGSCQDTPRSLLLSLGALLQGMGWMEHINLFVAKLMAISIGKSSIPNPKKGRRGP